MHIKVRVIPRSSRNSIEWQQDTYKIHLTAPPVDGAANAALIAFLAERLGLPKRQLSIVQGATSRQKTVEIIGMTAEEITQKLLNCKPPPANNPATTPRG